MGGLRVIPNVPDPSYRWEMVHADTGELFIHFDVSFNGNVSFMVGCCQASYEKFVDGIIDGITRGGSTGSLLFILRSAVVDPVRRLGTAIGRKINLLVEGEDLLVKSEHLLVEGKHILVER